MVAFTICSTNYYAHAKVLAKSWLIHHPHSLFYIVLVDRMHENVNYEFDQRVKIIPINLLHILNLTNLVEKYHIVELNTAIKADAFLYLFEMTRSDKVIYLDPDIKVLSTFVEVDDLLNSFDIIVTPHYTTPIDDGGSTTDFKMLGSGLFNLGFIAMARLDFVRPFLLWWRDRLHKYCYCDLSQGMFYDQVWCNYLVIFFERVYILKDQGYNVANWNFHERQIFDVEDQNIKINGNYPLRFIHFSGYKLSAPDIFSFYHQRFTFINRPEFALFFRGYKDELIENGYEKYHHIPCFYFEEHKRYKKLKKELKWRDTPIIIKCLLKIRNFVTRILDDLIRKIG